MKLLNSIDLNETAVPKGVWEQLAFPDLEFVNMVNSTNKPELDNTNSTTPSHLDFTIPVLTPDLICDTVPKENMHLEFHNVSGSLAINAVVFYPLPKGCKAGPGMTLDYVWLNSLMVDGGLGFWASLTDGK